MDDIEQIEMSVPSLEWLEAEVRRVMMASPKALELTLLVQESQGLREAGTQKYEWKILPDRLPNKDDIFSVTQRLHGDFESFKDVAESLLRYLELEQGEQEDDYAPPLQRPVVPPMRLATVDGEIAAPPKIDKKARAALLGKMRRFIVRECGIPFEEHELIQAALMWKTRHLEKEVIQLIQEMQARKELIRLGGKCNEWIEGPNFKHYPKLGTTKYVFWYDTCATHGVTRFSSALEGTCSRCSAERLQREGRFMPAKESKDLVGKLWSQHAYDASRDVVKPGVKVDE